jgi:hypothetical protein
LRQRTLVADYAAQSARRAISSSASSPHERSDMRESWQMQGRGCRCAHPGLLMMTESANQVIILLMAAVAELAAEIGKRLDALSNGPENIDLIRLSYR